MTDDSGCEYCDTSFPTDETLVEHLESHDRGELSRVDRKRVEAHADGESDSRLGRVTPDGRLSRRATLVAAGTVLAGIGVGLGRRMTQSATQIQNWTELDGVRDGLSGDYVLANDLDEHTDGYDNLVRNPSAGWDPIGDGRSQFTGTFDGQGYEIRDLVIDRAEDSVGLFEFTDQGALIENVGVTDATISGNNEVGVLVGVNEGTVTKSYATGDVTGADVEGISGGLVGRDFGTVTDSYWDTQTTGQSGPGAGTPLTTNEMQGNEAEDNMSFDFSGTWNLVVAGQPINPVPEADGYPILASSGTEQQLEAQSISFGEASTGIKIGADNTTLDNVTIADDN